MEPANDDPAVLRGKLQELRSEHRDLDAAIARLDSAPTEDELLLRRLKKRKLFLKDRIAALERALEPDEYA
ncbi:MAG: YdcH family protein [Ignavibacteria bacterium]